MNSNKQIHLWVVLILFTALIVAFVPAASAQNMHILMVIDNGNLKTGSQHDADKDTIIGLMKTQVAPMLEKKNTSAKIAITELLSNDRQMTSENIFSWLQNINPNTDDVVFVYFSGQGGADKDGAKERFHLIQKNEKLYRKEITTAMAALNCRLKILITEVNSVGPIPADRSVTAPTSAVSPTSEKVAASAPNPLRNLFLEHEGFLNLTSTSLGHHSISDNTTGGYFTTALMESIIPNDITEADRDPADGFVSWEEVFGLTKEYLDELFQANFPYLSQSMKGQLKQLNQTTQTPEALSEFRSSKISDSTVSVQDVPTTSTQNIHVLMMIDDAHPKTGTQHGIDKNRIEGLMAYHVTSMLEEENSGAKVAITQLLSNDRQLTRTNIFDWLQNLEPGTNDMVFAYFSGHGANDKDGLKEHYLTLLNGEKLYRREIAKVVEALNCRLKVLITETAAVACPPDPIPLPLVDSGFGPEIIRNLFLEHEGFLNLTSTSSGHFSVGDSVTGGYFTASLIEGMFPFDMSALDRNPQDGFVSWEEVLGYAKTYLNDLYKLSESRFPSSLKDKLKELNQTTQLPENLSNFPKRTL